ncbi:hypothetical protein RAJCM14343_2870 [Rhodococcus aetherivorans]|uniref:Uncharacterized protein n=1 Tax=Rhodococcus aetherivorans TaxID=191292 RepID=A0ABQ0YM23_9NOCA|nr:hypothetical protein RAJCM14343_2870 [Rhodococcus aetherivorans]CCW09786.1 hypothetical protein EBESD8_3140 [Rhodococcus aetherivorans]
MILPAEPVRNRHETTGHGASQYPGPAAVGSANETPRTVSPIRTRVSGTDTPRLRPWSND